MTKTFFLGLGGQKCGSSWIQSYLNGQKTADFGRLGEYQIWEADLGGVFARYRQGEPTLGEKLRARAKMAFGAPEPAAHLRWRLQSDRDAYFTYFAGLLAAPGITMSGDITPSYAALPAATLRKIREGMSPHARVKAIFAMRDPVARLRSHLNMDLAKGYSRGDLAHFFDSDEARGRSRYDLTLKAMEEVFAPEDRHICLFEELFTAQGIAALSNFAGIPTDGAAGARAVNARPGKIEADETLSRRIAQHYAPVYLAVARRLPQIETLWPSARFVL